MPCSAVKLPGGVTAIVCHRGGPSRFPKCRFCKSAPAELLCDFEIGRTLGGEPITCDAKVCHACAWRSCGKDFCPEHREKSEAAG